MNNDGKDGVEIDEDDRYVLPEEEKYIEKIFKKLKEDIMTIPNMVFEKIEN